MASLSTISSYARTLPRLSAIASSGLINNSSCNAQPVVQRCISSHASRIGAPEPRWPPPSSRNSQAHTPPRHLSSQTAPSNSDEPLAPSNTLQALHSLPHLSPRILSKVHGLKCRHDEISILLRSGGDQASLGKELSSLSAVSSLVDAAVAIYDEKLALQELLGESKQDGEEEEELLSEIQDELNRLEEALDPLSKKLLHSLVPMLNPDDVDDLTSADAVIDIRAGTGGDEAALFAAEIMAGYEAVAKRGGAEDGTSGGKAWDVEVLSCSKTDLGGVKEASLSITSKFTGNNSTHAQDGSIHCYESDNTTDPEAHTQQLLQMLGPYGFFQYESGVHRVQRVPVNDNKLQTSAVSVAVLPSLPDNQASSSAQILPPQELKIETMRASGAGGQHVNTTESAVRITHIPTGIMAYMQEERSQHKNKSKALRLVAARVYQLRKEQALHDRSATRSSLMGGGDRSERIRTYNFPQDRITDHRCKVSVSGVSMWLGGGGMVRKFGPYLYEMEREERVIALEEEDENDGGGENSNGGGGKKRGKKR